VVEQLAGAYAGKVKIGKLDVDESPGIAMKYGIRSVPTLLFFKSGRVVEEIRGAVGREVLESKLRSAFALTA
jgi:thioredoxin 1